MKTVILKRSDSYNKFGLEFNKDEPKQVDDLQAQDLQFTGYFTVVDDPPVEQSSSMDLLLPDNDSQEFVMDGDGLYIKNRKTHKPSNEINGDLSHARILFRQDGGIGDTLFIITLAEQIKRANQNCYIAIGCKASYIPFIELFDCIDEELTYDESCKIDTIQGFTHVAHFNHVLTEQERDENDYFGLHWARAAYDKPIPDVFDALRVNRMLHRDKMQRDVDDTLNRIGFGTEKYAVIVLGTSNPLKTLFPPVLARLTKALSTGILESGESIQRIRVLLLGSPRDRLPEFTQSSWIGVVRDQAIDISAELVRRAAVVFGCDTGLVQFAAAIGVPSVAYFGPTEWQLSIGHYKGLIKAFQAKVECSPCRQLRTSRCDKFSSGYPECMRDVPVDDIAQALIEARKFLPAWSSTGQEEKPTDAQVSITQNKEPVLTVAEMRSKYNERDLNIAVLLDNANEYTGGGFYTWAVAETFAQAFPTCRVWTLVDSDKPVYNQDGGRSDRNSVVYVENLKRGMLHEKLQDTRFDIVIGTPPKLGRLAVEMGVRHKAKSMLLVYETPEYIGRYRQGVDAEDGKYWAEYKWALERCNYVLCISNTVKAALQEWIPQTAEHMKIRLCQPCVREDVADLYAHSKRAENSIVMISRNMPYKEIESAINAVGKVAEKIGGVTINVVGVGAKKLIRAQQSAGDHVKLELHECLDELGKWKLLSEASAVIHPSSFEGFGIPLAEAMYAKVPVLAHPLEVFKDTFADYPFYYGDDEELGRVLLTVMRGHTINSESLQIVLDDAYELTRRRFTRKAMLSNVRRFMRTKFNDLILEKDKQRLESPAMRLESSVGVDQPVGGSSIRVAMVSSYNTKCGIAETTREWLRTAQYAYKVFAPYEPENRYVAADGDEVVRGCWKREFSYYGELLNKIVEFQPNVVHIQHEYSFFHKRNDWAEVFFNFLQALRDRNLPVVMTTHTYLPSGIADRLAEAVDKIVLTKELDDLKDNQRYTTIELPVPQHNRISKHDARKQLGFQDVNSFVVGSFGLWNQHKGYDELLQTFNDVAARVGKNTHYLICGSRDGKNVYASDVIRKHWDLKQSNRLLLFEDYEEMGGIIQKLCACDVLVFNYNIQTHTSASSAIRTGMQAGVPVVCTMSPMFEEFDDEEHVLKVKFGDVTELAQAIVRLGADKVLAEKMVQKCDKYVGRCVPSKVAEDHGRLYQELIGG